MACPPAARLAVLVALLVSDALSASLPLPSYTSSLSPLSSPFPPSSSPTAFSSPSSLPPSSSPSSSFPLSAHAPHTYSHSRPSESQASAALAPLLNLSAYADVHNAPSATPLSVSSSSSTTTTTPAPTNTTDVFRTKRSVGFLACAGPGLFFAFFGCRFLMITVFLGGFCIAAILFYLFSPLVFAHTPFCCGSSGSELGHVAISILIGVVGGLVACKLLRFGLCVLGAGFGLLVALVLLCTPLQNASLFNSKDAYAIWYGAFMAAGAVLPCIARKSFLLFCTSIGGAFAVFLGIDYFGETGFGSDVLYVLEESYRAVLASFGREDLIPMRNDNPVTTEGILMFCGWLVLAALGAFVQYRLFVRTQSEFAVHREGRAKDRQLLLQRDADEDEEPMELGVPS